MNDTQNSELKKILIVEDDEFLRSLTVKRLEKENYAISIAVDGKDALAKISESTPDLILLDLLLPGIDGFEVLAKMQESETQSSIPVLVFSNLGQREDIEKAKSLGADDFLIKANFTLDDVVAKVGDYLGKNK
jgi:two-component system phosphate regulon response regulator PhoB/two-component system alkaline phosphatase synthesis response regulator PhoP